MSKVMTFAVSFFEVSSRLFLQENWRCGVVKRRNAIVKLKIGVFRIRNYDPATFQRQFMKRFKDIEIAVVHMQRFKTLKLQLDLQE